MTYDQIQTFVLIASLGSFKEASQQLHRTQPSLSAAIKKLEEELGFQLFDRSSYRPKLTIKGQALLEKAQWALEGFDTFQSFASSIREGIEAEINFCMDAVSPVHIIGPFFKSFFGNFTQTKLNLKVDVLEGSLHRLRNKGRNITKVAA